MIEAHGSSFEHYTDNQRANTKMDWSKQHNYPAAEDLLTKIRQLK